MELLRNMQSLITAVHISSFTNMIDQYDTISPNRIACSIQDIFRVHMERCYCAGIGRECLDAIIDKIGPLLKFYPTPANNQSLIIDH